MKSIMVFFLSTICFLFTINFTASAQIFNNTNRSTSTLAKIDLNLSTKTIKEYNSSRWNSSKNLTQVATNRYEYNRTSSQKATVTYTSTNVQITFAGATYYFNRSSGSDQISTLPHQRTTIIKAVGHSNPCGSEEDCLEWMRLKSKNLTLPKLNIPSLPTNTLPKHPKIKGRK